MANNKVQLSNGTVVIDLSTDTVTSASHIKSGLVAHLKDGSTTTGTLIEKDVKNVSYNLANGVTASISTTEVVTGQGYSVKLKAPAGYNLSNVSITMGGADITSQVFTPDESGGSSANLQTKSVSYTPTTSAQSAQVTADSGYDGLEQVNVSVGAIPSEYIVPSGTQIITENNTYDVSSLAEVVVNVAGGGSGVATGTVTPSSASTTISFDTGLSAITGILIMPINTPLTGSRTQAAMICLPNGSFYKAISIHTNSGGTGWIAPTVYTSNKFSLSGTTVTVTGAYSFRPAVGYIWYAW